MALSPTSSRGSVAALTLLSTTTRATDGTFDVASIDQTYNDLIIVGMLRGTAAAQTDNVAVRLNNDSATNYNKQNFFGAAAATTASEGFAASSIAVGQIAAASAGAGRFGQVTITICGYTSTVWNKMVEFRIVNCNANSTTGIQTSADAGVWLSTAAVNRIQIFGAATANLLTGSTIRIYGRL